MKRMLLSAPGKAVLLGEYAVLEGSPALSLAIDRRARVVLEPCDRSDCLVEAPQLGIDPVGFRIDDQGAIAWQATPPDASGFERTAALIAHLARNAVVRYGLVAPFRLKLDTGELFMAADGGPVKLGLGSSAALTIALDAAITAHASRRQQLESPGSVLERLLPVYRATQQGQGSGIDLATSLHGGLIACRAAGTAISVERRRLPADLHLLFVWTGEPASTTELVNRWRQAVSQAPPAFAGIRERMFEVCHAGIDAVVRGDADQLARQMGAYGHLLGTMSDCLQLSVVTEAHRQAMTLAERAGAHYKPCGAGGGDLGVTVTTDPGALAEIAGKYADAGLQVLALAAERQGVRFDRP